MHKELFVTQITRTATVRSLPSNLVAISSKTRRVLVTYLIVPLQIYDVKASEMRLEFFIPLKQGAKLYCTIRNGTILNRTKPTFRYQIDNYGSIMSCFHGKSSCPS